MRHALSVQAVICAAVLAIACASCSKKKQASQDDKPADKATEAPAAAPAASTGEPPASPAPKQPAPADPGDFKATYGKTENAELDSLFRKEKFLEGVAADLNDVLALPRDIEIALTDCGEPNAYFEPDPPRIALCYELLEHFSEIFANAIKSEDEAVEATLGATIFTFFHELGHALVHVLDLPITGKEEDAVDQLAAIILIMGGEQGAMMALDGADSFLLQSEADSFGDLAFWDEHSLDEQRFYNIICLIYGSDPKKFDDLVTSGDLPEERAELCPDEYEKAASAWQKLLENHVKEP